MTFSDWEYIEKYFEPHEFDSPDAIGSGKVNMDHDFMYMLWDARVRSAKLGESLGTKVPYVINSAYRTTAYNSTLKNASRTSEHLFGRAVDISATNNIQRALIMLGLVGAGFTRFGISSRFIHVDYTKKNNKSTVSLWLYTKRNWVATLLARSLKNEIEDR